MTGWEASEMYYVIAITEFITLVFSLHISFLPPTALHRTPQGPLSVTLNRTAYLVCAWFCVYSYCATGGYDAKPNIIGILLWRVFFVLYFLTNLCVLHI